MLVFLKKFLRRLGFVLGICAILETIMIILLTIVISSACVQAYEISKEVYYQFVAVYTFVLTDWITFSFTCAFGLGFVKIFLIVYSLCAAALVTLSGVNTLLNLTFCGNVAQYFLLSIGIMSVIDGIFHLVFAVIIWRYVKKRKVLEANEI